MQREELTELDTDGAAPADFSGASRAYVIVRSSERAQVTEVPARGEVLIGRGTEATLQIDDARVSRRHARIHWDGPALMIEDLGSRNGTTVNAETLHGRAQPARAGDSIRIAGREMTVALLAPGREPKTAPAPPDAPSLSSDAPEGVVVADPGMGRVFGFARRVARTNTTVLILGETGTGKEVIAQQIHAWSSRTNKRFIRVNCAALPEPLVESELFGHERGAFTGAEKRKIGFAEAAHEGSLFLDEIGELSMGVQAKLLSMLENRAVVRLGNTVETPVDVRVIAATHRDLTKQVAEGLFREDLYYRVGVAVIRVPPLRQRSAEIPLLARLFARRFGQQLGWPEPVIMPDAAAKLLAHGWPGNVRELRNAIEHAMLLTEDGTIRREHLPETVTAPASSPQASADRANVRAKGVKTAMAELERAAIEEALRAEGGNRTRAARQLGISLRSLLYKIDKYGVGK
jgi:two-component system, NtrC family, response regulator AtoC